MDDLQAFVFLHLLQYLDINASKSLACTSNPLSKRSFHDDTSAEGLRFLSSFSKRPLRWGRCWLELKTEQTLFLEAMQRHNRFLSAMYLGGQPMQHRIESGEGHRAIPRIIHHIWLGSPLPTKFDEMRRKWQHYHPMQTPWVVLSSENGIGWEYRLWTELDVKQHFPNGLTNQKAFDEAPNYGQKADILRYEILYKYGGVYVDADMECLASLKDLHDEANDLAFYTGFSNTGTIEFNNGLIGSIPGHPLLRKLIDEIHQCYSDYEKEEKKTTPTTSKSQQLQQRQQQGAAATSSSSLAMMKNMQGMGAVLGFLGQDTQSAMQKAFDQAEKERLAVTTIERTGPGLFTRVIASWLLSVAEAGEGEGAQAEKEHGQRVAEGAEGGKGAKAEEEVLRQRIAEGEKAEEEELRQRILLLPPQWFYPVPNTVKQSITPRHREIYITPGVSRTIHHWACSWQQS